MLEAAAMGFVAFKWYTWPILFVVVMSGVTSAIYVADYFQRRADIYSGRDVRPCLVHMGTDPDGMEHWCWQQHGHEGPHHNQWMVPQEDFDPEPDEEPAGLCTWGEDGGDNEGACIKSSGHEGPHCFLM